MLKYKYKKLSTMVFKSNTPSEIVIESIKSRIAKEKLTDNQLNHLHEIEEARKEKEKDRKLKMINKELEQELPIIGIKGTTIPVCFKEVEF